MRRSEKEWIDREIIRESKLESQRERESKSRRKRESESEGMFK